jgi:putative prophage lsa1 DNA-binding protein, XRE family
MIRPDRLARLIEENRVTKSKLCDEVGISVMGLNNFLNKGTEIGSTKLEKIADYFKVSMDYFYDREIDSASINLGHHVDGIGNHVSGDIITSEHEKEIAHLKQLLEEKERTIQILMKQNNS